MSAATVHRCSKCHHPSYLPTVVRATSTVEAAPPKRGDPIPPPIDASLRNCGFCGACVIPRFAVVDPVVPQPSAPPRGAPIHTISA